MLQLALSFIRSPTTRSFSRNNKVLFSTPSAELTELSRLEIRSGKIIEIAKHPEADSLYVEKVDVGEAEPRTIVSGLVQFCSVDMLLNRDVVVLCNLKPRALKGITSFGMLLCASNTDKSQVEPLMPPPGSSVGSLMTFAGHKSEPAEPGNRASKAYDKVADGFYVDDKGQATYMGIPMMAPLGSCTSSHLKGKIS